MSARFSLTVTTPTGQVLETDLEALRVPAVDGQLGVLARHAPLLAELGQGLVRIRSAGDTRYVAVAGGFLQVADNVATILADAAVVADGATSTAVAAALAALPTH